MWLDAFKPKAGNVQNVRVTGVNGVSQSTLPMNTGACGYVAGLTPANAIGVNGVNHGSNSKATDTADTNGHHDKNKWQSVEIGRKANGYAGSRSSLTPLTPLTQLKHKTPTNKSDTAETLALFHLNLVQAEIEEGGPADDLRRVNNLAWRLMTAKSMLFDRAMEVAALWVVNNPEHPAEAGFVDVMRLYHYKQQGRPPLAGITYDDDDLVAF